MSGLAPTILAVCLGALAICIVSAVDFHAPYKISDIRFAVMRDRYYFAIFVYCISAMIFYALVLKAAVSLAMSAGLESGPALTVAIPASIVLIVLVSRLPFASEAIAVLRRTMQALARYPQAAETVTAIIARSPIKATERARPELMRELQRYGVPKRAVEKALATDDSDVLAVGATEIIQQVAALHVSFAELHKHQQFADFFRARKTVFDDLENEYRRMLRRSARAFLFTEDISVSDHDARELMLEISDFIAEECESIRAVYQRLLAEVVLSVESKRQHRTDLISGFGYQIRLPQPLPFAPLVAILAIISTLDFVFSVLPLFFMDNVASDMRLNPETGAFSAFAHCAALAISIFAAVYPKASTNFARPSLYALPWRSYVLFALVSYLVGVAILYLTYSTIDIPPGWLANSHPLAAAWLFSLIFLVNTLVLSMLLDVRLRAETIEYREQRLRDGIAHAVVMMSLMLSMLVGFVVLTERFGLTPPNLSWQFYFLVIVLFGVLGFVMGFLVPSTAEAYLEANKLIHETAGLNENRLGWAAPEQRHNSATIASVDSSTERRNSLEAKY